MQITTRAGTPADITFARKTHHAAYRDVVVRQWGKWDEECQDGFFMKDWSNAQFDVIMVDGAACGYTAVVERPDDVHVRELVVHPNYQNKGIGTFLLRRAMARASERGVPVKLGTCLENYRSQALYKRLGFREFGQTDKHLLLEWRNESASKEADTPARPQ